MTITRTSRATAARPAAPTVSGEWDDNWALRAQCASTGPDEMFVRGAAQQDAKKRCAGCPVKAECLTEALDNDLEWGVWGGMTERERRALVRRRPGVTSWKRLLMESRALTAAPSVAVTSPLAAQSAVTAAAQPRTA